MTVENRRQCENTRSKLLDLEKLLQSKKQEKKCDHVRVLTLRSIMKRINQFKEEIARFEARSAADAQNDS